MTQAMGSATQAHNSGFSNALRVQKRLMAAALGLALMAGCDGAGNFQFPQSLRGNAADADGAPRKGALTKTTERDIEAPDVFSATEAGLWDGRPSLGGVWVAHPDVTDPERVIIRNTTNGKFVVGALFRRERDIPGPRLQISSDAAEALGMLAGAPAELNVTALRKEEVPVEAPAPETVDGVAEPADVSESALDPIATASAAIDAAAPAPATASAATPAPRPVASNLDKPFIQIGIFSVEANANRTAQQMRSAGMLPTIKRGENNGKPFWRVVVGPAATGSERKALLKTIKAQGFSDAYAVTN
ncbi:SPOR domain-containing protein [Ascidiaceihabitans sp.]|uniref:SPOR domain-containing protein n=1 Tax=Ascidiaceihabitans sp. TaxID=1872644 RepID=UPI0032988427